MACYCGVEFGLLLGVSFGWFGAAVFVDDAEIIDGAEIGSMGALFNSITSRRKMLKVV